MKPPPNIFYQLGWSHSPRKDDFYVQFNGHTYGIDCYCFVQWNLKTGRRRRIRRGEPRPSPKSLQAQIVEKDAQMVEKDAQLKQVQSEKQSVLNENANLNLLCVKYSAENATLKSTVARLELLGVKFVAVLFLLKIWLHLTAMMLRDAEWKGLRKVLDMFILFVTLFPPGFGVII